jgi:conjugative transfer signal peptidase TraF
MKQQGYIINETGSLPVGLWRMTPVRGAITRGMVVSVCPPQTPPRSLAYDRGYLSKGRCASGLEPRLKPIAAIPGDEVEITRVGVIINGVRLQNSAPLSADGQGRPLPQMPCGTFMVGPGEVWLIATRTPLSFDSRYFGAIPLSAIEGHAESILITSGKRSR